MAGPAENDASQELDTSPRVHPNDPGGEHRRIVRAHAAKLYGQGMERKHIARIMLDHLVPIKTFPDGTPRTDEMRLSQARRKLRIWEGDEDFRDMIYSKAVVEIDMATPQILKGVVAKAKRGRVDAARFALELSGRHNPKGDQAPATVVVAINGIPRPDREIDTALEIEGEVVDEE